jgi:uncharacterized protein (TIGR03437 family)
MNRVAVVLGTALLCTTPAAANFFCTLSGTPVVVSLGGLAEPVGDIALQCAGPSSQPVKLTLSVALSRQVANPIDFAAGDPGGVRLWLDSAGAPVLLPVVPRLQGNLVFFENLTVASNAVGALALRVSGLRAEAAPAVLASVQIIADAPMLLPSNQVVVARGEPGLFATVLPAAACCAGPPLPATMDWSGVWDRRPPMSAVRVTEGHSGAFLPWTPPSPPDQAVRLLIRLKGLPPGSRVLAPDAVTGDNAQQPTATGAFAASAHPGLYLPATGPSLLLSRVPLAGRDGSGGMPMVWPGSPLMLGSVGEAWVEGDEAWVVYQVMDADGQRIESAEIPVWVFTPVSRPNETVIVRTEVLLAPLSDRPGLVPGAPLPRYRQTSAAPDCGYRGDCDAPYFPQLSVVPSQTTEFTLQSGGGLKDAYLFIRNEGGWFVEWDSGLRYISGDGWLLLRGTGGYSEGSFHYQLNPRDLPPGEYRAEIVIRQKNSPTGVNREFVIPVTLKVTEGPPPQPPQPPEPPAGPAPAVWAALTVPFGLDGPFANGGLMRLLGQFFAEETSVTVGGLTAQVISVQPSELLVLIPNGVERGMLPVVAANGARQSAPLYVPVLPVAPSIAAVTRADGTRNSEAAPLAAGSEAVLQVTGIALADEPVWVNVHDQWQPAVKTGGAGPGLHALRITIPADWPAMMTAVRVCVSGPTVDSICSHPAPVWIGAAP